MTDEQLEALQAARPSIKGFVRRLHGDRLFHLLAFSKRNTDALPQTFYGAWGKKAWAFVEGAQARDLEVAISINNTTGASRRRDDVDRVNAVFIDKDEGDLTPRQLVDLAVPPDFIVHTSNQKLHAYWLVDIPVEHFTILQKALAGKFGTDASVSDLPRMMRLPGTWNFKRKVPFQTRLLRDEPRDQPLTSEILVRSLQLDFEAGTSPAGVCGAVGCLGLDQSRLPKVGVDQRVLAALECIPADDRKDWLKVGQALHSVDPTAQGRAIWDRWSQSAPEKFDVEEQRKTWDGFTQSGGVGIASLFYLARQYGGDGKAVVHTEASLADDFCAAYGDRLRFDPDREAWFAFRSPAWIPTKGVPVQFALELVKDHQTRSPSKTLDGYAKAAGAKSIVAHAQTLPTMMIDSKQMDTFRHLIGVANGVIDTRTGTFRPAMPQDMLTLHCPVEFDPQARASRWDQFMDELCCRDQALHEFIQQAMGATLCRDPDLQRFFLMIGEGGNGKGVFMRMIAKVLGPYATSLSPNVLSKAYSGNPNGPSPALMVLQHALFIACSELAQGRLDEAFVKQASGGDTISARANYGEMVTFTPPGKLWISTNHLPEIAAGDKAMWRRIVPIPCKARWTAKTSDVNLEKDLDAELPGIFNWLMQGVAMYRRSDGKLDLCNAVRECLREAKRRSDSVQAWIDDCCREDDESEITASMAYDAYAKHARKSKREPLSNQAFPQVMEDKGYRRKRRNFGMVYKHLKLME
ncbi:phage/plasmid primase, P4 family [uncultured Xylophilus sp.]|uniref:phage/plasmid primase, P4 family n=1 Tax=uncultured Xylophilus sp. TaxID=296832 RepID=UPI0025FD3E90|nr:phage/plasmid primase, P4 family [uncultured Xylophilus sp.]